MLDFEKFSAYFENGIYGALFAAAAIIAAYFVLTRVIKGLFERLEKKGKIDITNVRVFNRIISAALILLAALGIAYQIKPMQQLTLSLLAGSSLVVVVVGFAAQETVANLVSGVFITIFKPFSIGNTISLPSRGTIGVVEDISLRHTVIRTFENNYLIIPNSVINNEAIVNYSSLDERMCNFLDIGIAYDADYDKACEIIRSSAEAHPDFLDVRTQEQKDGGQPAVAVRLIEFGASAIQLRAFVWSRDRGSGYTMLCDLRDTIKRRFDAEGIEIPYSYTNVVIKKEN